MNAATTNPDGRWSRFGRKARTFLVTGLVGWQLFFLFARNVLDFYGDSLQDWLNNKRGWQQAASLLNQTDLATARYGNFSGLEQDWSMFSPPMGRWGSFLAVRIEFSDGTAVLLRSENEPDPNGFFRIGGFRQRKLEDRMVWAEEGKLPDNESLPLFEAYASRSVAQWLRNHPEDRRVALRVALLRREFNYPEPGSPPLGWDAPRTGLIAYFDPDGRLQ